MKLSDSSNCATVELRNLEKVKKIKKIRNNLKKLFLSKVSKRNPEGFKFLMGV